MRRRLRRWLLGVGLVIVVLLLGVGGVAGWFIYGSLPKTSGALTLKSGGLSAPATIARDAAGIVTINAANEADGYFALGFAHAQDRLFQMETMRRLGAGRLSEIVGEAGLRTDKLMRLLGLERQAEAQLATASPELLTALESYAAGVNAYLAEHSGPLPLEFQLLRLTPEPWHPVDSLLWGRIMAWQLSGNAGAEIENETLRGKLDPDLLRILMRAEGSLAGFPAMGPTRSASNNWVVAGRASISGQPLLANDPHLGFNAPVIWYMAKIITPDTLLAGATAPGMPLLVIGSNGHVAWGFTTTHSDTQDLFEERLSPDDPTQYMTPSGWQKLETRRELIKVKDGADVALDVRVTRHGPLISDLDPDRYLGRNFALRWIGDMPGDQTPEAFTAMSHAADAVAFRRALRDFHTPQQNVVYADTNGHIGFVAAGRVPLRRNLSNQSLLPAPGWVADYDWSSDTVDFSALPHLEDPRTGRIVTANNDVRPPFYRPFLGHSFDNPYRRDRIEQLLAALPRATTADFEKIQLDDYSAPMHRFVKAYLPAIMPNLPLDLASAMSGWDGRMRADRPEPLIATAWLYATARRILADKMGAEAFEDWWFGQVEILDDLLRQDRQCDDVATGGHETCADAVRLSLAAAIDSLKAAYGPDWQQWRWGAAHAMSYRHPIFARIPELGERLVRSVPAPGDHFTINRGGSIPSPDGAHFADVHGPGLRIIFDMNQPDRPFFTLAGGQSGHPLSPHYADLLLEWVAGTYRSFDQPARDTLTLRPAGKT
jgi:penicillin amidase